MSHLEIYLRGLSIDQLLVESGVNPKYKHLVNIEKQEIIEMLLRKQSRYTKNH